MQFVDLANVNNARGLLTFLFGLTTVGIAIIVVLSVFLSTGPKEELADRFQRGKDVLTVLIGVFGAILGFYFGTDKGSTQPTPPDSAIHGSAANVQPAKQPPSVSNDVVPPVPAPTDAQPTNPAQPDLKTDQPITTPKKEEKNVQPATRTPPPQ